MDLRAEKSNCRQTLTPRLDQKFKATYVPQNLARIYRAFASFLELRSDERTNIGTICTNDVSFIVVFIPSPAQSWALSTWRLARRLPPTRALALFANHSAGAPPYVSGVRLVRDLLERFLRPRGISQGLLV
jgi:hypothetical protein